MVGPVEKKRRPSAQSRQGRHGRVTGRFLLFQTFVFSFRPVAAGGAGRGSKGQAPPFLASRTLTASQGNAAKPGGRARRPCLRQTPLVELYSGEPALTRDAGCRSASLVWTCAQLHYLTKRQQRNVDNETTYKTSAMKQPKRSGLAWSHGRDAALLRAVSSRSSTTPTNQPHHHRYHAGLNHSASTVT